MVPAARIGRPVVQFGPVEAKLSHRRGHPSHKDISEPEVPQQTPVAGQGLGQAGTGPGTAVAGDTGMGGGRAAGEVRAHHSFDVLRICSQT